VATQTDIQCFFQLLHEPVNKKKTCKDVTEGNILCRVLLYVFIPATCIVIMGNIGVTGLMTLGKVGGVNRPWVLGTSIYEGVALESERRCGIN